MSALYVGDTIKITGTNRHPAADALLVDHVDVSGATIVDIGASDGSTSVDLIAKLGSFGEYVIADLYFHLNAKRVGTHRLFYGPDGELVLVAGRRALAWPGQSRAVRALYASLIRRAEAETGSEPVLLLNPTARALIAADSRVSYRVHDVFTPWDRGAGGAPDVIKVANLLRRLYFSDADITTALRALLASLADGGHLLLVDNPRIEGIAERAGLYRRDGDHFLGVAYTEHRAEIDDLVLAVRLEQAPPAA